MRALRTAAIAGAFFLGLLAVNLEAQGGEGAPSLEFGGAEISLGMTIEQVQQALGQSSRHIDFLSDKHTAIVRIDHQQSPNSDEGQITFFNGRAVYASFQFPVARNAADLAQELAGAIESTKTKTCSQRNYASRGTGGGTSQVIFDCGLKTIIVMTIEELGNSERPTFVEIDIGTIPRSTKWRESRAGGPFKPLFWA